MSAISLLPSLTGCVGASRDLRAPPPTKVTVQVPAIPASDRAATTFQPVPSPYVTTELCVGALKAANGKNARNVQRVDELAAVLAGKGVAAR